MIKQLSFLLFSMILVACAPNRALKHFEKEELYAKALQYTNKCDIVYDDQVKVLFTATYLNSVDAKWNNDKENFIVGVYVVETKHDNEPFYNNEEFQLKLDETSYVSFEPLNKEHEMFNNLPLHNSWASYFVISFKPLDEEKTNVSVKKVNTGLISEKIKEEIIDPYSLKLILSHTTLGSCTINFPKE
ncbi:MAG: hypothetical protein WC141_06485 [Arcobacteraceae bacterium]